MIDWKEKYELNGKGNVQVIDMLKEEISAGSTKIRWYKERELHYHQNTLFATNQKQFYWELYGRSNIEMKSVMLKKILNFAAIFGRYLEVLTKMLHGYQR